MHLKKRVVGYEFVMDGSNDVTDCEQLMALVCGSKSAFMSVKDCLVQSLKGATFDANVF